MIKIAFIIDTIHSPTAGTERQLLSLLSRIDKSHFQPTLYLLRSSEWLEKEFNLCPFHVLGISSFKNLSVYKKLVEFTKVLKSERSDITHTFFSDANKIGIIASKMAGVPVIISSRRNQGYWHNALEKLQLMILNPFVDHFIVNSESTKEWASRTEGINKDKITVINNGLDLKDFTKKAFGRRAYYREELEIHESDKVVGIVANLRPVKRIDLFLKAASLILRKVPQVQFVVVGECDNNIGNSMKQLAFDLGMSNQVKFLGIRTDVPGILSAFDVGVLTSDSESSSNAITEYMAAGLPVVCTDTGGAREAVKDGLNGHIVPCGDQAAIAERIVEILKGEKAIAMGHRGRERARDFFSMENMVSAHEATYNHLIKCYHGRKTVTFGMRVDSGIRSTKTTMKIGADSIDYYSRKFFRRGGRMGIRQGFLILTYHKINSNTDHLGLSIPPDVFEQQIMFLKRHYQIVSLKELLFYLKERIMDRSFVAVTFDDGYQDNFINAFPILKRYGVPATIFITVQSLNNGFFYWNLLDRSIIESSENVVDLSPWGYDKLTFNNVRSRYKNLKKLHSILKQTDNIVAQEIIDFITKNYRMLTPFHRDMLSWDEIRTMLKSGLLDVGSHTLSHPILTRVEKSTALSEIRDSKEYIEEKLGSVVDMFSYPNGLRDDFDDSIVSMVKESGYHAAFTMIPKISNSIDFFTLPRLDITQSNSCDSGGRFSQSRFAMSIIRSTNPIR